MLDDLIGKQSIKQRDKFTKCPDVSDSLNPTPINEGKIIWFGNMLSIGV